MPGLDDVADSTDWLQTPLAGLAPFESGLRCQVCKDFFTTPMITSCSHTFCSLCIRRYLSQEGRCPACRESDQEMKLRRNWTVEELVAHFVAAREGMLSYARQPQVTASDPDSGRPKKRRKIETTSNGIERRSTRSQSKRLATNAAQASQEPLSTQEEIADSYDEGSVYGDDAPPTAPMRKQPQPAPIADSNDDMVECPCCTRRVKEANINAHLDRCIQGLASSPEPTTLPSTNGMSNALSMAQRTKSPLTTAQKDRLPSINYALYTETSLRKKLKELGVPPHGNKELMRKRHIEWVNLWNANCDSSRPRTKRELLKDLDTWERTLGRQIERGKEGTSNGVMVKDFDRDGWMKSQKGDFDDLIKQAREKRQAKVADNEAKPTMDAFEAEEKDPNPDVPMEEDLEEPDGDMHASDVPVGVVEENAVPGVSIAAEMAQHRDPSRASTGLQSSDGARPETSPQPASPIKQDMMDDGPGAKTIDLTSSPAANTAKPTNLEDVQPASVGTPAKRSRFFN